MTTRTPPALIPDHSYTVETHCGCKVVRGTVPIFEMAALTQAWGEHGKPGDQASEWVIDAELAGWLDVTLVAGRRDSLIQLRERAGFPSP